MKASKVITQTGDFKENVSCFPSKEHFSATLHTAAKYFIYTANVGNIHMLINPVLTHEQEHVTICNLQYFNVTCFLPHQFNISYLYTEIVHCFTIGTSVRIAASQLV
jgi:hypothetical protein